MANQRIGIFGGTFDPPHFGHLILAMEASDQLSLEKVLWILSPQPPHKRGEKIASLDIRIRLVKAAIDEDNCFELSYVDINRPGPHYVLDTMKIVREEYPDQELVFLMGGDSLHDLLDWYKSKAFIAVCDKIGVMRRPGEVIDFSNLTEVIPEIPDKVEFVDAPLLEISSTQIRQLIAEKKPYRYYVPLEVFRIIEELSLYSNSEED